MEAIQPIPTAGSVPEANDISVNAESLFVNDAVNAQVESGIIDSMVPSATSRVLLIYTGGTIGMQNTHQHGYRPVKGYLTQTLANMLRFHTRTAEGLPHPYMYGHPSPTADVAATATSSNTSAPLFRHETNAVNITLTHFQLSTTGGGNDGSSTPNTSIDAPTYSPSDVRVVNGTSVIQTRLPALISPPSLYGKRINYSILEYDPLLDSSNMTMTDWVKIARDIEVNYRLFDAFIILHGTDTMAYTASALSFMLENLGKTVIITGSQVPLAEVRNDAVENLLGALTIAGHFVIPEVGLFFDNKLFRGNRSSKVNAVDFNAFDSPNLRPLVSVGINIDVSWVDIWRPKKIAEFLVYKEMNPSVANLRLFPGITEATVRAFLSPPIAGVVLETYGSGNAPSNRPELLQALQEACDRGVVIVNCTQCKRGLVTDIYQTGKALKAIGIVPGADMTPECALTKLSYLLSKYSDPDICRRLMKKSLRGELTLPLRRQRFTYFAHPGNLSISQGHVGIVSSVLSMLGVNPPASRSLTERRDSESRASVASQHLEDSAGEASDFEDISGNLERVLVPLLLCQVVRANDTPSLSTSLEEYGYMVDVPDYDGRTPLHVAASEGQRDCVEILLRHGANVHVRDNFGQSSLFDAVSAGHSEVVSLLRKAGAHFATDEQSEVAWLLSKSTIKGDVLRVRMLIECGADLSIATQDGRTALHLAVSRNHIAIVQLIINAAHEIRRSQSVASGASQPTTSTNTLPCNPSTDSLLELIGLTRGISLTALPHTLHIDLEPVDDWNNTPLDDANRMGNHALVTMLRDGLAKLKSI
ncbi:hypothetical protein BSLG_010535 [Batrachochytrium salamandrivorans]|nr:hypothetical protein BASA60_003263 [Batrachochytrium salamandrivorans]KAJ1327193.1 hypothetical protein BSLG_010535 [Batrachochytrium salamandrivorans]